MSIKLSQKHGVNPAIPKCFVCGNDKNMIILAGRLKGDIEAPRGVAWDKEPCDECEKFMGMGVIMISTRDGEEDAIRNGNPYRTGGRCVVKDEAIKRIITDPDLLEAVLKKRMCFLEDKVWDAIGLPREDVPLQKNPGS